MKTRKFSYGASSAIVTSMALIVGLDAATANAAAIVSGLLIVAFADNLTDSLSIHIYQESEHLASRQAFRATVTNFATRLAVSVSFVGIVLLLPGPAAVIAALSWGFVLLVGLTYLLARERQVAVLPEIGKHVALAIGVLLASRGIAAWISSHAR